MGPGPWAWAMGPGPKPIYRPCWELFFRKYFVWRSTLFYENIKVPYRNSLQYAEARTSRSLLCVRKRRETIITKHSLLGEGRAVAEEFSEDLHPPIPSHPGMKYPVRASPSLRQIIPYLGIEVRGIISGRQGGLSGVVYIFLYIFFQNNNFKMILSPVASFSQSFSPWELTATHFGPETVIFGRPETRTSVIGDLKSWFLEIICIANTEICIADTNICLKDTNYMWQIQISIY